MLHRDGVFGFEVSELMNQNECKDKANKLPNGQEAVGTIQPQTENQADVDRQR